MSESTAQRLQSEDGHAWTLQRLASAHARARVLWLPALGVSARHYRPFAQALSTHGIDVWLHEWRGHGSSNLRASRRQDWGYAQLLQDILASARALEADAGTGPLLLGGHSLGGQLACCAAALHPELAARLWLVGTGMPWAPAFAPRVRYSLPIAIRLVWALTAVRGYWNGHRIGFGGREAKCVMRDWAHTARHGRYVIPSLQRDLDPLLAHVRIPADGVTLADDAWAPEASLAHLLAKLGGPTRLHRLEAAELGVAADHFSWMRQPERLAQHIARTLDWAA